MVDLIDELTLRVVIGSPESDRAAVRNVVRIVVRELKRDRLLVIKEPGGKRWPTRNGLTVCDACDGAFSDEEFIAGGSRYRLCRMCRRAEARAYAAHRRRTDPEYAERMRAYNRKYLAKRRAMKAEGRDFMRERVRRSLDLLTQNGWTATGIAQAIHVSPETVRNWIRGDHLPSKRLRSDLFALTTKIR